MDFTWGGRTTGSLTTGCIQCIQGRKSVLFITGQCNLSCYYCPVSSKKMHNSHMYINEVFISENTPLNNAITIIKQEIKNCGSRGISITGGDPLLAPDRIIKIGRALKEAFGKKFHIHLYTPGREGSFDLFSQIVEVIDEIRFHPVTTQDLEKAILALDFSWDVGLELPATYNLSEGKFFNQIIEKYVTESRIRNRAKLFMNLNELEITEANYARMDKYIAYDNIMEPIVQGSREEAYKIQSIFTKKYPDFHIFFCPQSEKDNVQIPKRYFNRAQNVLLSSDILENTGPNKGLLMRGVIKIDSIDKNTNNTNLDSLLELEELKNNLIKEFDIPDQEITLDYVKQQLLTLPEFVDEFATEIKSLFPFVKLAIIEESPTVDRIEFTTIHL